MEILSNDAIVLENIIPANAKSITIEHRWLCNQCNPPNGAMITVINLLDEHGFVTEYIEIKQDL